jgi:hypothetical protein
MIVPIDTVKLNYLWERRFYESLIEHKRFVLEAGIMIGGIPIESLFNHDASKFWPEEFPAYARQFFGPKDDPDGFARAWLHHMNHNPHHWQYWIFPDGHTPHGSSVFEGRVEMPEVYIREMIADWMGASRAYTQSWDLTEWLNKNLPKVKKGLHPYSVGRLELTLKGLGYPDEVVFRY